LKPDPSEQPATDEMSEDGCPHQSLDHLAATAGKMMESKVAFEAGEQQLGLPAKGVDRAGVVSAEVISRDVGVV